MTGVGKQVTCPKCAKSGILKVKEVCRKNKRTSYLYCYHYNRTTRKVRWCYVGTLARLPDM